MLKNITNLITAANKNIETLAWEPSVAQGTHSYLRRLPALGSIYRETNFSP